MATFKHQTKQLTTPEFVISYPKIGERVLNEMSGKMGFSCDALVKKGTPSADKWLELEKTAEEFGKECFGVRKFENWVTLTDCDEEHNAEGVLLSDKNPELKGMFKVKLKNERNASLPVADHELKEIDANDVAIMYGGCVCRAVIVLSNYSKPKAGITKRLMAVQKIRDGEKFGTEDPTLVTYLDDFAE